MAAVMIVLAPTGGGLGNLLFQYHAAYTHAKQAGSELYILTDLNDDRGRPNILHYARLFQHAKFITKEEMHALAPQGTKAIYEEECHFYVPIPKHTEGLLILRGYFQSYKYFTSHAEEISQLLRSNEQQTWNRAKSQYAQVGKQNTVSVHIRRGDYKLRPTTFLVLPESYYEGALARFPGRSFLVYAEDIDEITGWDVWKNRDVSFVKEPCPLTTIFMIAQSQDHIISNSTLSLMGVHMCENKDRRVVGPDQWFGPDGPAYKLEDFYVGDCGPRLPPQPPY